MKKIGFDWGKKKSAKPKTKAKTKRKNIFHPEIEYLSHRIPFSCGKMLIKGMLF